MATSRQNIDGGVSEKHIDQPLNGYQKLPDTPVEDVISRPNETTDYEGTEYDVERLKVAARRRALKHIQVKEEDSLSAAFCTWLFEHQIG